ncbi:RIP metalloprotease RseP [Melissococcus plutonius]|uniref:Zinc metalloprotease n=1 Tax=Melissococcus plutonius (strain ATCC 35311 / DSM 29964 / CIP 104052 / LMG 20360 / NCIMB 702443) TaxID=940190 RepID=F3YAY8_MELPT|nr:RIP metalloprotease RseP [Melissococcus plutonius]AIM25101.1 putative protease Eep [Melissococcus plutonius S1]KMT25344.1 putative protease Eep [Melissococcus plutonius]KMT25613.1 putative protease Eep [Melissococcus plutonius]KMT26248.1 putative protease Eep [Melissococcus plutonius]KMT28990.1 putative protease Eep [Melissococcus plutonius]
MKTILTFIIVFGVLVLVHEFGHFFFAKRSGILVREFSIGMGPKIFEHQGKDGTAYTIRILPIGGYVRMAGMGEEDTELQPGTPLSIELNDQQEIITINTSKKIQLPNSIPLEMTASDLERELYIKGNINGDSAQEKCYPIKHDASIIEADGTKVRIAPIDVQFQSAKLWQRMLTNFAGPMNNFLLAIVLFTIWVFVQGGIVVTNTNHIGQVLENSPAMKAGLKSNDEILSVNHKKINTWTDLTSIIQKNSDKKLTFVVKSTEKQRKLTVIPETKKMDGTKVGTIGITAPMKTSFSDKLLGGIQQTVDNSTQIFKALGSLVTGFSLNKLGGPVMMFQLSEKAAKTGLSTVIWLMAMLSINLGIVNLLPIPALDGGKIILNIFEAIFRKPLSQEKEGMLTLVGFGFLMVLMVLVTWNDIQRFFF